MVIVPDGKRWKTMEHHDYFMGKSAFLTIELCKTTILNGYILKISMVICNIFNSYVKLPESTGGMGMNHHGIFIYDVLRFSKYKFKFHIVG